jgi:hypothetical protein
MLHEINSYTTQSNPCITFIYFFQSIAKHKYKHQIMVPQLHSFYKGISNNFTYDLGFLRTELTIESLNRQRY